MSSTTNFQSLLPWLFHPVYSTTSNGFTTTVNLSNIDKFYANTATFGTVVLGDSSNNVYLGSNSGNTAATLGTCNASYNTSVGILSAFKINGSSNSEFIGYQCGAIGKSINNSFMAGFSAGSNSSNILSSIVVGTYAGYTSSNISNSILIGTSNSSNIGTTTLTTSTGISNTISIGGNAGGTGTSNIYIGMSTGTGMTGSCNTFIGSGLTLATAATNNRLLIGSGGNVLISADSSNNSMAIGSGLTLVANKVLLGSGGNTLISGDFANGAVTIGTAYPSSTLASAINSSSWGGKINFPATSGYGFLALDVAGWTRISSGLTIATDPAVPNTNTKFELDVNGHFRVQESYGILQFSNYYNSGDPTSIGLQVGSSNGPTTANFGLIGSNTTVNVLGPVNASNVNASTQIAATAGYSSYKGTIPPFTGQQSSPIAFLVLPSTFIGSGTVTFINTSGTNNGLFTISTFFLNATTNNNASSNIFYNSATGLGLSISGSTLQLTAGAGTPSASLTIAYNVTLFPVN